MVDQAAVTIVADIKPGAVHSLKAVLDEMCDAATNQILPFAKIPGLHFTRFVLMDSTTDLAGQLLPPSLVFLSDIDKPVDRYLDALVDGCGEGIDHIFGHCAGSLRR